MHQYFRTRSLLFSRLHHNRWRCRRWRLPINRILTSDGGGILTSGSGGIFSLCIIVRYRSYYLLRGRAWRSTSTRYWRFCRRRLRSLRSRPRPRRWTCWSRSRACSWVGPWARWSGPRGCRWAGTWTGTGSGPWMRRWTMTAILVCRH